MIVFFFGIIGTMQGVLITPGFVFHDVEELTTNSSFQKARNGGKTRLITLEDLFELYFLE